MRGSAIAVGAGAAVAALAVLDMPYAYYQFTRWAVTASAIVAALVLWNDRRPWYWFAPMVLLALLFNPLIPFHFGRGRGARETWRLLDGVAAVMLVGTALMLWFNRVRGVPPELRGECGGGG